LDLGLLEWIAQLLRLVLQPCFPCLGVLASSQLGNEGLEARELAFTSRYAVCNSRMGLIQGLLGGDGRLDGSEDMAQSAVLSADCIQVFAATLQGVEVCDDTLGDLDAQRHQPGGRSDQGQRVRHESKCQT
jgi:hypothetical protein